MSERSIAAALAPVILEAKNLVKNYGRGDTEVQALRGVNLTVPQGEFTAILGPSGSGKSTLLNCLAALDTVTSGSVILAGEQLVGRNDAELTALRARHIGFVFQAFNLVPTLSAAENIALPAQLAKKKIDQRWQAEVCARLGLNERLHHKPNQLSGGQQQRVALARALVSRPSLIVADEPTGNLDTRTGEEVIQLLRSAVTDLRQTVIMVTHDLHAAAVADRALILRDGQLIADLAAPTEQQLQGLI